MDFAVPPTRRKYLPHLNSISENPGDVWCVCEWTCDDKKDKFNAFILIVSFKSPFRPFRRIVLTDNQGRLEVGSQREWQPTCAIGYRPNWQPTSPQPALTSQRIMRGKWVGGGPADPNFGSLGESESLWRKKAAFQRCPPTAEVRPSKPILGPNSA